MKLKQSLPGAVGKKLKPKYDGWKKNTVQHKTLKD